MCLLAGVYQVMVANCRNYHDTLIAAITGLGSDSKSIGPCICRPVLGTSGAVTAQYSTRAAKLSKSY